MAKKERKTEGLLAFSKEENYSVPTDPKVQEKLEWFRDQKLGLFMHFGPYTQMSVDCSWPLSDADASWSRALVDWEDDVDVFRKQYIDLNKSFNPIRFQPDKWAEFAAEAGFKYMIFTAKHHDGFCMFDTKYTDYKVTNPDCPFHTHKYANITREVFDAFRKKGIGIGAYFSKPDWHCPWYWAEGMERPVGTNRHPTYNPAEYPELWEKFIEFTHNQIMELMTEYGDIDLLWLDGSQLKPKTVQDIHLIRVIEKAREFQPGLISVDRQACGQTENYITPENRIPDHVIKVPWESCLTVGNTWIYSYSDTYKSSRELVSMLVEVVSKGGNLALGVGPQPDGRLPEEAMDELLGLGEWLKVNGDAIYGTRALDIGKIDNVMYTKKGDSIYAIIPLEDGETLAEKIFIPINKDIAKVTCLGSENDVSFTKTENGMFVSVPEEMVGTSPYAVAFKLD